MTAPPTPKIELFPCGYCMTAAPIEDMAKHGLEECAPVGPRKNPALAPSVEFSAYAFNAVSEHVFESDWWAELKEDMAETISSDYRRLTDKLVEEEELTDAQAARLFRAEERAGRLIVISLLKRLAFVNNVVLEDLLA